MDEYTSEKKKPLAQRTFRETKDGLDRLLGNIPKYEGHEEIYESLLTNAEQHILHLKKKGFPKLSSSYERHLYNLIARRIPYG